MRPFLKWAGGKYNLLPHIQQALPEGKRLIEPFVGSGAVFLNIEFSSYLLADANHDLINLYGYVQQEGQDFIKYCRKYFNELHNDEEKFYYLRDKFNQTKNKRLKSAIFLYLNRHGYNGLCRYNSSGKFNVPFGEYNNPLLPEDRMVYFHQKTKKNAEFIQADFMTTMDKAKKGDIVYCDPPYVPLSETASFTAYSPLKFDEAKQIELARKAEELAKRGVPVIVSNHDTKFTRKLYKKAKIKSFKVRRFISCHGAKRNLVRELIAIFM